MGLLENSPLERIRHIGGSAYEILAGIADHMQKGNITIEVRETELHFFYKGTLWVQCRAEEDSFFCELKSAVEAWLLSQDADL